MPNPYPADADLIRRASDRLWKRKDHGPARDDQHSLIKLASEALRLRAMLAARDVEAATTARTIEVASLPVAESIVRLRAVVVEARSAFLEYAENHRTKATPDLAKVRRNEDLAARCFVALAGSPLPPSIPSYRAALAAGST